MSQRCVPALLQVEVRDRELRQDVRDADHDGRLLARRREEDERHQRLRVLGVEDAIDEVRL